MTFAATGGEIHQKFVMTEFKMTLKVAPLIANQFYQLLIALEEALSHLTFAPLNVGMGSKFSP